MFLVLDLETVRDETLPAPRDPNACKRCGSALTSCKHLGVPDDINDIRPGSSWARIPVPCGQPPDPPTPAPPYHQIVAMGVAHIKRDFTIHDIYSMTGHEALLLSDLFAYTDNVEEPITLVGFNSRGFDVPVLVARALRHGLTWKWYYQDYYRPLRSPRFRFDDSTHLDAMDQLAGFGASKFGSLDVYARLVGMPGKELKGDAVADLVERGELGKLAEYNASDVLQTWAVALRYLLLKGACTKAEYQYGAREICRVITEEALLSPLEGRIEHRFLLED